MADVDVNKVLERVQKLVALAGSDNENEARNAAVLACRMIREHKVRLTLSEGEPVRERPAARNPFTGNPFENPFGGFTGFENDPFWDLLNTLRQQKERTRSATPPAPAPRDPVWWCKCGQPKLRYDDECAACAELRRKSGDTRPDDELSDVAFGVLSQILGGGSFYIKTQEESEAIDRLFFLGFIAKMKDRAGFVHANAVTVTPKGRRYFEERAEREEYARRAKRAYPGRRRHDE